MVRALIFGVLLMGGSVLAAETSKTIVVLGDSLAAGYGVDPEKERFRRCCNRISRRRGGTIPLLMPG